MTIFFFLLTQKMERRKGRTWGYDSLAKARGTLREAAHTVLEAHTVLVCPPRVTSLMIGDDPQPSLHSFLACAGLSMRVPRWGTDFFLFSI